MKNRLLPVLVCLVSLFLLIGCDSGMIPPTSPDTTGNLPDQMNQKVVTPTPPVTQPVVPFSGNIDWSKPLFTINGPKTSATMTNALDRTTAMGYACYSGQTHDVQSQTLGGDKHVQIIRGVKPGEEVTATVALHCGWNQCDAFFGLTQAPEPPLFGHRLLGAKLHFYDCPGTPKCVQPPQPGDDCTWNPTQCKWVCQCTPDTEPECPRQKWNPITCQWVGECPQCEKTPVPQGRTECSAQSTPSCVPLPCCTFNWVLCQWDCPDPPETKFCHVSNKGFSDGDWNIQEQTMNLRPNGTIPPGHRRHFNRCPPDYLGPCDGRSLTHPCLNTIQ
jgi:hypothetical protein